MPTIRHAPNEDINRPGTQRAWVCVSLPGWIVGGREVGISLIRETGGISVSEHQPRVATEQVDVRDFCIRLIGVMGMVAVALVLLLAVQPS